MQWYDIVSFVLSITSLIVSIAAVVYVRRR